VQVQPIICGEYTQQDEPTSNIDPRSVDYIHKTIQELNKDAFVIVISHRLDVEEIADVYLTLEDGRLIEENS